MQDAIRKDDYFTSFGGELVHEIEEGNAKLTRGAFGEIALALLKGDDRLQLGAIKTIFQPRQPLQYGSTSSKRKIQKEVMYELCALRLLDPHPHVAKLLALYPSRQDVLNGAQLSLVFEYCPADIHLSLEWRRRTFQPLLSFPVIKTITRDLFSALHHCHSNGLLHRDIKPGNLLLSSSGIIKLCDFGLAKPFPSAEASDSSLPSVDPTDQGTRGLCTLYYRPPEVLLGGRASRPSVDVYSAGLVVGELVTGRPLFKGTNVLDQLAKTLSVLGTPTDTSWPAAHDLPDYGKLTLNHKEPQEWKDIIPRAAESRHLVDFLQDLVALDPDKRTSALNALNHSWIQADMAPRAVLQRDLVPSPLQEPLFLSSPKGDLSVATKQTLVLAATRRNFLTSLEKVSWHTS